jgi:phospholipase C
MRYLLMTGPSMAVIALAGLGVLASPSDSSPSKAGATSVVSPIKHVVIIYEENHTFDNLLGELCLTRVSPCDGDIGPVTFADGVTAANIVQPDIVPSVSHAINHQDMALSNRWDEIRGCDAAPYPCVSHVSPEGSPNVAALARAFAVSDRTFAAFPTASYGAHIQITAGRLNGFSSGRNPITSRTGAIPLPGWGCPSHKDVRWHSATAFVPSCVPTRQGNGPYRESPVKYRPTIMERTEQAGFSWHVYQGESTTEPVDDVWSVCTYFAWCYRHRFDLSHNSGVESLITAAGTRHGLPNLSMVMPTMASSQHNLTSMIQGDNYIGRIVSAIQDGPQWQSTAIFITWDDCGCFYDHVVPPAGRSFRNPMIIVSPWAKAGYTDSTTALQPYSMLTFIQHTFGLAELSPQVSGAYDYTDSFDFTQTPLTGPRMTRTHISEHERARLRKLAPLIEDSVT